VCFFNVILQKTITKDFNDFLMGFHLHMGQTDLENREHLVGINEFLLESP